MAFTSEVFRGDANTQLQVRVPQWTLPTLPIHLFFISKLWLVSGLDETPVQVWVGEADQ